MTRYVSKAKNNYVTRSALVTCLGICFSYKQVVLHFLCLLPHGFVWRQLYQVHLMPISHFPEKSSYFYLRLRHHMQIVSRRLSRLQGQNRQGCWEMSRLGSRGVEQSKFKYETMIIKDIYDIRKNESVWVLWLSDVRGGKVIWPIMSSRRSPKIYFYEVRLDSSASKMQDNCSRLCYISARCFVATGGAARRLSFVLHFCMVLYVRWVLCWGIWGKVWCFVSSHTCIYHDF